MNGRERRDEFMASRFGSRLVVMRLPVSLVRMYFLEQQSTLN